MFTTHAWNLGRASRDNAALEELSDDRPHVLVDDDLGSDQEWERQEADMDTPSDRNGTMMPPPSTCPPRAT